MAELFHEKVFDESIAYGATTQYTTPDFDELLGSADRLSFMVVVNPVSIGPSMLQLQVEHSGDGQHWQNKNVTPEIDLPGPGAVPRLNFGDEPGATPSLAFVRLRVAIAFIGSGSTQRCNVTVYATVRER
jgi:hypothetical protein